MTADRLATLQRRAAADPGDVHAQAAWLRARVQAGELTRERVELAAYCGDAGARVVLGGCGDHSCAHVKPTGMATNGGCRCPHLASKVFPRWLRGLARWGDEVMVRAVDAAFALPNQSAPIQAYTDEDALLQLASEVGERPVREAIQRALIAWALS